MGPGYQILICEWFVSLVTAPYFKFILHKLAELSEGGDLNILTHYQELSITAVRGYRGNSWLKHEVLERSTNVILCSSRKHQYSPTGGITISWGWESVKSYVWSFIGNSRGVGGLRTNTFPVGDIDISLNYRLYQKATGNSWQAIQTNLRVYGKKVKSTSQTPRPLKHFIRELINDRPAHIYLWSLSNLNLFLGVLNCQDDISRHGVTDDPSFYHKRP